MSTTAALTLELRPAAKVLKALGDPMRLRIVALLSHGELCVCHIEAALSLTQATASRHLAVLRNAGVVEPRRAGHWVFYRLAPQGDGLCGEQLTALRRTFGRSKVIKADVERLLKSKGPGACS